MNRRSVAPISPVMQQLSAYIARALRKPLPAPVVEKTKHHVLDTIAAMLSGSRLPPGKIAISFARTLGGVKEACVVGSRIVTGAANAALANGMLAHADETDDSHAPSLTHPGCGIVPAALAFAEREPRNGTALLHAVARRLSIPRGRPFDAQFRPDVRRRSRSRCARELERAANALLAVLHRAAGLGDFVLDAR
jgi:hypothetical protein